MGIYRHYKGPLYQVFGLTHDANNEHRICVLYIGLELDKAHLGPRLAVRTIEDFVGYTYTDWTTSSEGYPVRGPVKRFTYLGPELTEEMIQ